VVTDPGIGVKLLTGVLIVIMAGTMFITQKQMMAKNMSESAMANPMMQSQKMLLYVMPLIFGIGGIYFPLGVLIYWLVSNTWTMFQQMFIIRSMPAPGSQAERDLMERRARRGKSPLPGAEPIEMKKEAEAEPETPAKTGGQRQQPVNAKRRKKKRKKR